MDVLRMIVDRCHVGESNLQVIRYSINRLVKGYDTFKAMAKKDRRKFLKLCIKYHADNKKLYNQVMKGF